MIRQNGTLTQRAALLVLGGLCWVASSPGEAAVATSIAPTPFTSNTLSSPTIGTFGPVTPITVLCSNSGVPGDECRVDAFGLSGANAPDFEVSPGGSCNPGVTILGGGGTCTVNLRYRASSPTQETALLQASCTTVTVIGGFTVLCIGSLQSFDTLFGNFLPPAAAPTLDRTGITLLALLVLATGAYLSLRRPLQRR